MSAISPDLSERVRETLRENKRVLRDTRRESAVRERNAKQSRFIVERAIGRLRRAGLLE